jgi:hypothetical protein
VTRRCRVHARLTCCHEQDKLAPDQWGASPAPDWPRPESERQTAANPLDHQRNERARRASARGIEVAPATNRSRDANGIVDSETDAIVLAQVVTFEEKYA